MIINSRCIKTEKMHQTIIAGYLQVIFLFLMLVCFPFQAHGNADSITVFWIETDPLTEENFRTGPVKDFYINGGKDDGISESMELDVYREVEVPDPKTGKKFMVDILVGNLKVISLFDKTAITRIISITSSEDTPVLRYRTVMLGDYIVLNGSPMRRQTSQMKEPLPKIDIEPGKSAPALLLPSSVLFKLDNSILKAEAAEALSIVQNIYNKSKNKDILIEGHTCNLGSPEYNMELSMKRAQSVSDYLSDKMGIPAERIRIMYYGEKFPIASNNTEEGRTRNRRVSIRFLPRRDKIAQR